MYYGYPFRFYFDPTYFILIIGMIFSLAASAKMKSTFAKYFSFHFFVYQALYHIILEISPFFVKLN